MTSALHTDIRQLLAQGEETTVGEFAFRVDPERWWWSDTTYRIHGFEPGEVVPTTQLLLAHCAPDEQTRPRQILDEAAGSRPTFAQTYRMRDAQGHERVVSMVGTRRQDDTDVYAGYVMDLTPSVRRLAAARADESIRAAAVSRRDIEQAKAVVAMLLVLDDDEAFAVLRTASNNANLPLRALATDLMAQVHAGRVRHASDVAAFLGAPPLEAKAS